MPFTYEELKKKNVSELREIANSEEGGNIQGYTQMNKEHLLEAICKALNIDMHEHHEVVGLDKSKVKARIRELKKQRDAAIQDKKPDDLKRVRVEIKNLKKQLRRAMV